MISAPLAGASIKKPQKTAKNDWQHFIPETLPQGREQPGLRRNKDCKAVQAVPEQAILRRKDGNPGRLCAHNVSINDSGESPAMVVT
jgi:hypothetical protein